ncbi:hypothetical protein D0817_13180 [Flavobacterium cupreum]|uniref:Uncharacterized protein n=1 Tax=Flavobacterium cupreum TaxID=2133766 RepID=A0A434A750_9FLAO|nr:hypothetical protein D0817_13180 [Flavobacterium cupreum]
MKCHNLIYNSLPVVVSRKNLVKRQTYKLKSNNNNCNFKNNIFLKLPAYYIFINSVILISLFLKILSLKSISEIGFDAKKTVLCNSNLSYEFITVLQRFTKKIPFYPNL